MAMISSPAFTVLSTYPNSLTRYTPLSSSSSVFFSYNVGTWTGLGHSVGTAKKRRMSCNSLFGLGVPELAVIAGVVVLVFGPKKLPEVGRSLGKSLKGFQEAAKEFESELKKDSQSSTDLSEEKITTVSEEENQEAKVPSKKESS